MVQFESQVYHKEGNSIIGAEVIIKSDAGETIQNILITDESSYNNLVNRIEGIVNECVGYNTGSSLAGETIETILANLSESTTINATKLNGLQSDQYSKVTHTHTKNQISDLYNYNISLSDYNVDTGSEVTVTVKVTKQNNLRTPVANEQLTITKDGATWKSGPMVYTNSNGVYKAKFTPDKGGFVTFGVENQKVQLFVKDIWETLYSGDGVTLQKKGDRMRLSYYAPSSRSVTDSFQDVLTFPSSLSEYIPNMAVTNIATFGVILRLTVTGVFQIASARTGSRAIQPYGLLEWTI